MNLVAKHLEKAHSYVRILFIDFSSAFNAIQPHILLKRMIDMNVRQELVLWISYFLTNSQQQVRVNGQLSKLISISTGAPQVCVLSPTSGYIFSGN